MGSPYDPDPRDPRDRDGYGRPTHGDVPPRGRAQVPPGRGRGGAQPPPEHPRGRVESSRDLSDHDPYDQSHRRSAGVGRASVRPGARREAGSPQDAFDAPEPITGVARVGEARPGQGGRHAGRRAGALPSGLSIQRALRLRGRLLATTFAVLLVLTGGTVLGGSYFLDSVELASELDFPETTTVLYSDGSQMAKLGEVTRYALPYDRIIDPVKEAIVASEDQTFWTNEGVDVGGVVRAAWNNFTGGRTQGASTITQQYARLAYELKGVTYQRKLKEAVLAWKMNQTMDKWEILEAYLNAVPFGRQAYGVEAAAKAFFGKSADKDQPEDKQLTMAEAMVLVAMVKQPYPDPDNPEDSPGYDPTLSDAAAANARRRFEYVRGQLVTMGRMSPQDAAALVFPETVLPYTAERNGLEGPAGHVVHQVLSELTHTPTSPFFGDKDWTHIEEGGYQIQTTVNRYAQTAARRAAGRASGTMKSQPDNLQAALVAIQPGTGRVLAYFGGDDGTGSDFAGTYLDEHDDVLGVGYHPPGSSFKVYTLAAALKADFSLQSYWDWNPHDMPGREGNNQIENTSACGDLQPGDPRPCSLLQSVISSVNVPFYQVTLSVGADKVLTLARDAGIDAMWTNDRERVDLRGVTDMASAMSGKLDSMVGIGQYPVTVLDHANGLATIAAGGRRATAHFVEKVTKNGETVYGETLPAPDEARVLGDFQINDLTYALSQVPAAQTSIGWDTAGKTGTWEYGLDKDENAHAWMVGFSRRIAAAVWVGNRGEEGPLYDSSRNRIYGSGLPATIWRAFMAEATDGMDEERNNTDFNQPNMAGEKMPPGAVPSPEPTFGNPNCRFPFLCPPDGDEPPTIPTGPGFPPPED